MILVDFIGWWYTHGYVWAIEQFFVVSMRNIAQFFSMKDLLNTLFSPFRQDALQGSGTSISVKFQIFFGNIISRIFGLIIRTALLIIGALGLILNCIVGLVAVAAWLLLPLIPVIAVMLFVSDGVNL